MKVKNFGVAGEGARFDGLANKSLPMLSIFHQGAGSRKSRGYSVTCFWSDFISVGICIGLPVERLPMTDSSPIAPIHHIFAAPFSHTSHTSPAIAGLQ